MKKYLLLAGLLFIGCSQKEVFVPKKVINKPLKAVTSKELQDYTKKALTFKDLELRYVKPVNAFDDGIRGVYVFFDEKGKKLGEFKKINKDLAVDGTKMLLIKEKKVIKLPFMMVSGAKKENIIAIVFENNAIGVYDLDKNRLIFYKEFGEAIIGKYLKAFPIFYKDLILFPLLDSNIAVYDLKANSYIRTINLADENLLSNIIFLKIVNNQLFMATPNKLVMFDPNYLIDFKGNIKHIISSNNFLYVFLVGGDVIKFDTNLKQLKKVTLPFADYFAPTVCKDKIYTVTRSGYLIEFDKDLNYKVYGGNKFNVNEPLRLINCKIYNEDRVYFIK